MQFFLILRLLWLQDDLYKSFSFPKRVFALYILPMWEIQGSNEGKKSHKMGLPPGLAGVSEIFSLSEW